MFFTVFLKLNIGRKQTNLRPLLPGSESTYQALGDNMVLFECLHLALMIPYILYIKYVLANINNMQKGTPICIYYIIYIYSHKEVHTQVRKPENMISNFTQKPRSLLILSSPNPLLISCIIK
jgi:hypothetical protein